MGWILKLHKQTKQWKIWSTISESDQTDWLPEEAMKAEIANFYEQEYKLKVIELFWTFPHGWTEKESHQRIENWETYNAFHRWKMQAMSSGDYEKAVDRKFKEITGRESDE